MNRQANVMRAITNYETIAQWIDQSRCGDRDAFACLVRHYQGMVSGVALSRTGDIHQSEDLAQDTFLLAWQKLAELDDVRKFPGWLCSIARNLARNAVRKKSEQTGTTREAESKDDPAAPLVTAEQNALITAALHNIPEKYREPLVLFYRGEQSVKQIADALEITEETARQRLSRARKFLRSELERRIAGIISSTGPGEFFSMGVIAALPLVTAMTGSGQAAAATLTTGPVAAAVICTPSGCGSGGTCATPFSLTGFAASIFSILCLVSFWFCWIAGLVPSLWRAVHNAPTLRVRRYLILTSLRLHFLFAVACSFGCSLGFDELELQYSWRRRYNWDWMFSDTYLSYIYSMVCIIGWGIVGLLAAIMLPRSIFGYRQVLREEAGLIVPKKAVPLEESPLSYKRLQRSFLRYGIAILVLFLWMVCVRVTDFFLATLHGENFFQAGCGFQGWEWFLRSFGMQYMLVGLLWLIMFYVLHRSFLRTAKDEESFAATPAIVNHDTPFRERVFIEWLVSFGLFCAAGLYASLFIVLWVGWIPRSPVSLFEALVLLLAVTFGAAVLNVRLPILRWFVNPIVIGFLFALVLSLNGSMGWKYLPFQDFFDSPQSYPVLFGLIVLDAVIVFATATTMILGVVYLRSKTTGRFFSRRTITWIFCAEIAVIFVVSLFLYVPGRVPCFADILVCRYRDDWTSHHNAKMAALASEIIRSTSETDYYFGWAHDIRADMNLRERKYDEAIADYDTAIRFYPENIPASTTAVYLAYYHNSRGEAKFAKGDFAGALEDFDKAIDLGMYWSNGYYNRGFAHEKLGNIEAALADYDKAIAHAQFQNKPPVVSNAPRIGYDDESRRMVYEGNLFGYVITFEELVEIRNRVEEEYRN